ncbi:MAG: hypothetical protein U0746_13845 [Gemmataceae bacterium]
MDATTDPATLLEQLDAERLASRLREVDGERRALLILLRVARARKRERPAVAATVPREMSRA